MFQQQYAVFSRKIVRVLDTRNDVFHLSKFKELGISFTDSRNTASTSAVKRGFPKSRLQFPDNDALIIKFIQQMLKRFIAARNGSMLLFSFILRLYFRPS